MGLKPQIQKILTTNHNFIRFLTTIPKRFPEVVLCGRIPECHCANPQATIFDPLQDLSKFLGTYSISMNQFVDVICPMGEKSFPSIHETHLSVFGHISSHSCLGIDTFEQLQAFESKNQNHVGKH